MDRFFLPHRWTPGRWMLLGLTALLAFAGIAARGGKPPIKQPVVDPTEGKLEFGLEYTEDAVPIFVRMADQLIGQAGDFEKFCQDHQNEKRSEVRAFVIKTLRQKSEESWKQISALVAKLQKSNDVDDVERFWIVNGFSCEATAEGCKQLAASNLVSFVYKQADEFRSQTKAGKVDETTEPTDEQKKAFKQALSEWKDDSDEPFSTAGLEIPWNLKMIQADKVWQEEKITGKGAVVAVCDTGLMETPALLKALWKNPKESLDGKDDDGNGYTDDIFGYDFLANTCYALGDDAKMPHGSICSGIIAGRPINSKKLITGVAPRARLMFLRGHVGDLKVYEYVLANGADVISMSQSIWNIKPENFRGLYRTSQEHLVAGGVLPVGGSGNFSNYPKGKQIGVTKDIPCVMTTAGVLQNGKKAPASGQGPCFWEDVKFYGDYPQKKPLMKPDVTGPFGGYPVWCRQELLRPNWKIYSEEDGDCALVIGPSGNSFSAPHTSGVAALMLSANPELNAWEVKQLMEETCKDIGPKGRDTTFGAGLLQALEAVRAAKKVKK